MILEEGKDLENSGKLEVVPTRAYQIVKPI